MSVVNFTVATERNYKTGDEKQSDFIDCTAWRGLADTIAKFFHKGDPIFVKGHWESEKWTNKEDGKQRKRDYVLVEEFEFIPQKKQNREESQTGQPAQTPSIPNGFVQATGEELPF